MNGHVKKVFLNAVWLAGGNASSRIAMLAVLIIAARMLGPSQYGTFAALQGISVFVMGFASFGFATWTIRSLSETREHREVLDPALTLTGAAAFVLLAGIIVVGPVVLGVTEVASLALLQVYALSTAVSSILNGAFVAREHTFPIAVLAGVEKLLLLALIAGLLTLSQFSLIPLTLVYALSGCAKVIMTGVMLQRQTSWSPRVASISEMRSATREAWPFGLTQAVQGFGARLDAPVLALYSPVLAGVYSAAFRFLEGSIFVIQAVSLALFPSAVSAAGRKDFDYRGLVFKAWALAVLVGAPVVLLLAVAPDRLMRLTYGSAFVDSGAVLFLLSLAVPLVFINVTSSMLLNACGREKFVLAVNVVAFGARLAAMAILPAYLRADGAALAVMIGAGTAVALYGATLLRVSSQGSRPCA
jgi:O-antigen/teichoic acid export membrane protein